MKSNTSPRTLWLLRLFVLLALSFVSGFNGRTYSIPKAECVIKTERGLEIRYILPTAKEIDNKGRVIVNGEVFELFKTRNSAIDKISLATPKKDYTIVYVLSDIEKPTEVVTLSN